MTRIDPLIEQDIEGAGALVVPSGPRAVGVQLALASAQLDRGRHAWRTPDVIAYRGWLEREAYRAADGGHSVPLPLRAAEEWLLWREAAAATAAAEGFDAPAGLADALHRAARLLYDWEIPSAALRSAGRAESRLLARALASVDARTRELHAAGSHQLAGLLQGWRPRHAVTFAGFTEEAAARRTLRRMWTDAGIRCRDHDGVGPETNSVESVRAYDAVEELERAAEWCRRRLQRTEGERLLVVVPDLAQRRGEALRVFRRALVPQAVLGGGEAEPAAVAVEGGTPLAEEPLIRHALAALEFLVGGAEAADVSAWLRAAFWTAPGAIERARLDAALRQVLGVDVTPPALLAALRSVSGTLAGAADRLHAALEAALGALGPVGRRTSDPPAVAAPLGEWARRFERALHALGWPGERGARPLEQQAAARFAEVLGDLAAIGAHTGSTVAGEALRMLAALAERRTLAPPTCAAAVTLTAALADPIVRYSAIWIAGLHADAWPAPVELDPFIPFAAQRHAGIPSADGARRLAQAREVLRRCRRAAAHLVVSWPARGEQREYGPSPLLAELLPARLASTQRGSAAAIIERAPSEEDSKDAGAPPQCGDPLARWIRASRRIEVFEDAAGDPWPIRSPLPSGTRAIEYQSRCPFRAYAELRLAGVPLAAPRPGIGALERGRLLHRALELLWGRLGGSTGLEAEAAAGMLMRRIEECVAAAGDETLPVPRDPAARAAQRRERQRAGRLLAELSGLERQRPPFRVLSTELRRNIEIAGATLDVRIDRLDELDDGSSAVFDYKTGRAVSIDWLAERIGNPQLLVYALAAGKRVSALAMVHLAPRHIAYRGMADRRDRLPRIDAPAEPALWPRQVERWEEAVGRLAREFLQGAAAVDPLGDACATCHLHGFCRIAERRD